MRTARLLPVLLFGLSRCLVGQGVQELTLPSTAANTPSTHADRLPFQPNPAGSGWRMQSCYERGSFQDQGVYEPVDIRRLRMRAWGTGLAAACQRVSVQMSTASVPASALTNSYRLNHGPDVTTVFSGPVQVAAVTRPSTPGPYHADLQLSVPFRYDPYAGDLLVDIRILDSDITGGPAALTEYMGSGAGRGRLVAGDIIRLNATIYFEGTMVLQVDYTRPGGVARAGRYGRGCPDQAISAHETFPRGRPFDLSGTAGAPRRLAFASNPGGYVVGPRPSTAWHTPATADLGLRDDECSPPQTLPFSFPFVQRDGSVGQTNQIVISSNGFVWLDPARTEPDFTPTVAELLGGAARIAGLWTDLAPNLGGSVHFDVDPTVPAAYVTWLSVRGYSTTGGFGANTFQIALFGNGSFEVRWAGCGPFLHASVVGWSPGGGARDLGPTDLSAVSNLRLGRDGLPLDLLSVNRPILGTTFQPWIGEIPTGTVLGALCLGFDDIPIDLAPLGMTGCTRWTGWDVVQMVSPAGATTAVASIPLPPNPALAGVVFYGQAVMFAPGYNPMGIIASNGLNIRLDVN